MPQANFDLNPKNFFDLKFFVPHSGVCDAYVALLGQESYFAPVYIFGPAGSGKTHLVQGFLAARDYQPESFILREDSTEFTSVYDRCKSEDRLLVVECAALSYNNPHISSRIKNGLSMHLSYPSDEEFLPVVRAIAERKQIKLDFSAIEQAAKRLPKNLHVVDRVISELFSVSLEEQARSGPRLLNRVLGELL